MRTESSDPVTTEDVLYALGRYRIESNESDRQTATKLGINCLTLKAWLRGRKPVQGLVKMHLSPVFRATYQALIRTETRGTSDAVC